MKKIIWILIILCAFAVGIVVYIENNTDIVLPWNKNSVIQTTLDWGGLHNLPPHIENLKITKQGNTFSGTFVIEFDAPVAEIESWKQQSPRLKDNVPEVLPDIATYSIFPGEKGSFGGTVTISKNHVKIKMSWG